MIIQDVPLLTRLALLPLATMLNVDGDDTTISQVQYLTERYVIMLCLITLINSSVIFKTCNKAAAWRPLAYIPDQDLLYYFKQQRGKMSAAIKQIRMFKLYNAAL